MKLSEYLRKENCLFLAGGITDCTDWQQELIDLLKDEKIVLLNPRRKNFPINNPNAAFGQIKWEHKYLIANC